MSSEICRVTLTGGNVRNHHFYLRDCRAIIPDGAMGGKNKDEAGKPMSVTFQPGSTVETDIDGDKMILRDRKAVREFFESSAAKAGDAVVIERSGPRGWTVWLEAA